LTSLDADLGRTLEPRAAGPQRRLKLIEQLAGAGIPVGVLIAPVIPVLTDAELETLLTQAQVRGARSAGYVLLRLPHEVAPLFEAWLDTHHPLKTSHVLNMLREMHGGDVYRAEFGHRMRGAGPYAQLLEQRFKKAARRLGLDGRLPPLDCTKFRKPGSNQLSLF
jgi:DNA repair photolyase